MLYSSLTCANKVGTSRSQVDEIAIINGVAHVSVNANHAVIQPPSVLNMLPRTRLDTNHWIMMPATIRISANIS